MGRLPLALSSVIAVGYPLAVYLSIGRMEPHWLGGAMAALMVLRAALTRHPGWLLAAGGVAALSLLGAAGGSWTPMMLYPVAVSLCMLALFGWSLIHPPTVVERIARLADGPLDEHAVAYTRKVTWAWCVFFVCNGLLAAAAAVWATAATWALYTGLISYVLIGLMLAGERVLRHRIVRQRARQEGADAAR